MNTRHWEGKPFDNIENKNTAGPWSPREEIYFIDLATEIGDIAKAQKKQ